MAHASNMSRQAGRAADEVKSATDDAKHRMQSMASDVAERAQRMGAAASEAVKERFEDMKETASDYYEAGRDKAREWEKVMERRVQDRPVVSVLTALAIGFAVGFLCRRS